MKLANIMSYMAVEDIPFVELTIYPDEVARPIFRTIPLALGGF